MNQKTKVLITPYSLKGTGGVTAFYNTVLPYLNHKAYTVDILRMGSDRTVGRYRIKGLYPLTDQLRFRRSLASLGQQDIVHINPSLNFKSFLRDGLLVYQAKLKRLPVLVFFHGWQKDFEQLVTNKFFGFFKKTFGKADAFIVLSGEFKKTLKEWGVTQPIYLGTTAVDESLLKGFSIADKLYQLKKESKIRILFLARLHKEKGVFETVDAVSMLIQKGLPVMLSIAGDGLISKELRDYIRSKEIARDHIRMLGDVRGQDKISAFVGHDVYCLPTYYGEGLPTSVLEALAFGLPVITRPVAGLAEIFQDGKMGFLCRGKTPAEIAGALEKLINDRQLLLKISQYNYVFAKEHFMASAVAKRIMEIYQSILNEKNIEMIANRSSTLTS
jgi:glycosyltransferase involved in cell wall biosynthesis